MTQYQRGFRSVLLGLIAMGVLSLTQFLSASASGVFYVAPTGNDANSCLSMSNACLSIGSAVSKASSGDTIIIAAGTYHELIRIDKDLTLIGFGADATIIDQGQIYVARGTVNIFDLALTRGGGGTYGRGGSLYNDKGVVTLSYTSILSSYAVFGGDIFNNDGALLIDHSIIANNSTVVDGGGIEINGGAVLLSHSQIVSNTGCNETCPFLNSLSSSWTRPANG